MMKQEDLKNLRDNPRRYMPPADLWNKIESELDYQTYIRPLLPELPQHRAPEFVWKSLSDNFTPRPQFLRSYPWIPQAAAAIFLLAFGFGLGIWLNPKNATSRNGFTQGALKNDVEALDMQLIDEVRMAHLRWCTSFPGDESCHWLEELSSLEAAQKKLENAVRRAEDQAFLRQQIRRVELDKSRLIRQMAQKI